MAKALVIPKPLKDAVKGLSFPSETDAPITAFAWPAGPVSAGGVRAQTGADKKTPIEELSLAEFFRSVPHSFRGNYHELLVAIADVLSGVKVFKLGTVRIRAYVVGVTEDGIRAGIQTELVET
jgi:hypothetical protein